MTEDLYLMPDDQFKLKALADFKPHALLIKGYRGMDMASAVQQFKSCLAEHNQLREFVLSPEAGKAKISIAAVRELKTKLKLSNRPDQLAVVTVEGVAKLSLESATALLKILEEPSGGVVFIFGLGYSDEVLPTVASRCYQLKLKRPNAEQVGQALKLEPAKLNSVMMLSGGNLKVLNRLVGEQNQGIAKLLGDAKTWATSPDQLTKLEILSLHAEDSASQLEFMRAVAGIYNSLINYFIQTGDIKKVEILSTKVSALDELITSSTKLNLNKRVIQIKMLNL